MSCHNSSSSSSNSSSSSSSSSSSNSSSSSKCSGSVEGLVAVPKILLVSEFLSTFLVRCVL